MDNRNAFERQLADEIDYEVGPPLNVDALAITRQARSTSPRWRYFTMSSTLKFAAGASILAVAGAAFLLVAPSGVTPDDGVPPPSAEQQDTAEPSTTTRVTGTIDDDASSVVGEGDQGRIVEGIKFEMDDPRLTGTATLAMNVHGYEGRNFGATAILGYAIRIENEGGSWSGQGTGIEHSGGTANPEEALVRDTWPLLTGAGEYAGLSAYLMVDAVRSPATVEGVIFAGEAPPLPEVPS